jgi:hypothetical protein
MKAQEVRNLLAVGDFKSALRGAKDFRLGVSSEQRSVMRRAYEAIVYPKFYQQLGIDVENAKLAGIEVLKEVMG